MLRRRLFLTFMGSVFSSVLLLPSFVLASKNTVTLESGAKDFIEKLAEEALISLTKSELTVIERRELFRDIMRRYFAFKVIAKWVLGRFWKYATDIERTEYLDLFEQLMVITYADRFQTYSGEKLVVVKSETRGKNILVHTRLERPNNQEPIAVIWRLQAVTSSYGIVDVMVEGFSMGLTQKKEFKSVIRKSNNKVEALLSELRKRINAGT